MPFVGCSVVAEPDVPVIVTRTVQPEAVTVTLLAESAAETALPAMLSCACSALFDHARSWMLSTADCGVSSRKNCA